MNNGNDLLEMYYTRREWMVRSKKSYADSYEFRMYMLDLYNVIRFKNQIKRYFILKGQKRYGKAMEVIEAEMDYCYVGLSGIISGSCVFELRESDFRKTESIFNHKINLIVRNHK